jgi:glycosyltransferase involved in cell wall biosynthesis
VHVVRWKEFDPHSLRARLGFLSLKPRSILDTYSSEMAQKITDLLGHQKYDLVIASQLHMAAYVPYLGKVPAIFEELEIGLSYEDSLRALNWKKRLRHAFTWFKLRMYLTRLLESFRAVTVVSEQEKELVRQHFPRVQDVLVIPNCMNMDDYENVRAEPKLNTLIFTGSFRYHTNYEAMLWFVGNVFPLVLRKVPDASLIITGDHVNLPLPSMRNVILAGYVDDIKSLIASCTVALAPLWSGGGTRLKILEAMAIGTPVVATSKGAEGLDAKPGKHLFVADEPEEFAECVLRLLSDGELRRHLAASGNELVRARYDWGGVMPEFLWLVDRISRL